MPQASCISNVTLRHSAHERVSEAAGDLAVQQKSEASQPIALSSRISRHADGDADADPDALLHTWQNRIRTKEHNGNGPFLLPSS